MKPTWLTRLHERAERRPDTELLTFHDVEGAKTGELRLGALIADAQAIAGVLRSEYRVAVGDRVLLCYPPSLEFVRGLLATMFAGAVPVPVYPPAPGSFGDGLRTMDLIAQDTGARVVLTDTGFNRLRKLHTLKRALFDRSARPKLQWASTEGLDAKAHAPVSVARRSDDVAFLQYTSGSTSRPKGVRLSWANLEHQLAYQRHALRLDVHSRAVLWVPTYHDLGLIGGVFSALGGNGSLALISPLSFLRRPAVWFDVMHQRAATHTAAPDFAYALSVRKTTPAQRHRWDLSSLAVAMNAAEPVRASTARDFLRAFEASGLRPEAWFPAYGLAEHAVGVTMGGGRVRSVDTGTLQRDARAVDTVADGTELTSCGRPRHDVDVRIVEPDEHRELPTRSVGEIWVDSPSKSRGYEKRRDLERAFTAELRDGRGSYLRTGDLGFVDETGELYVVGRLKDLLIIGGRNVFPNDIEDSVRDLHPDIRPGGVAAVSLAPRPNDPDLLAILVECRQKRPRQATLDAIVDLVHAAVVKHHHLVPHTVAVLANGTLLKTTSGKIRRQACARAFVDEDLETIHVRVRNAEQPPIVVLPEEAPVELTPEDATLAAIVDIAADTLGLRQCDVDVDVDVTRLGLSSLLVLDFVDRVDARLGTSLPPTAFFGDMTLRDLATVVRDGPQDTARVPFPVSSLELGRPMNTATTRVAIVGAGVSGLAAAVRLVELGYRDITIFEAEEQVGGKVLTVQHDGETVELGAMLLSTVSEATRATLGESWNAGDFTGHAISLGTTTKPPVRVERDHFAPWLERVMQADAATPANEDDLPLYEWLEAHQLLDDMSDLHKFHWTGFGYGDLKTKTPNIYFRRYLREQWPPHGAGVFQQGHQTVWRHLAESLRARGVVIRTACPVDTAVRDEQGVELERSGSSMGRFDEAIFAVPPHILERILDCDDEEQRLLSAVRSLTLRLTVCRVDGAAGYATALDDVTSIAPGAVVSCINQQPGLSVIYQHPVHPQTGERVSETVLERQREVFFRGMGASSSRVLLRKEWNYFPHFPHDVEAMEHAFERHQGVRRSWFVGSYLGMEVVDHNCRQARALVERGLSPRPLIKPSPGQLRMYLVHQLAPHDASYNIQSLLRMQGPLDEGCFRQALDAVVMRHDALRMTIAQDTNLEGGLGLQIASHPNADLAIHDLRAEGSRREEELSRIAREQALTPFAFDGEPLVRLALVRMSSHEHAFCACYHHTVVDGWSLTLLVRDLSAAYTALVRQKPSMMAPVPMRYAEWAATSRSRIPEEVHASRLAWWADSLAGVVPYDWPHLLPEEPPSFARFSVGGTVRAELEALARATGTTMHSVFFAAWFIASSSVSGQRSFAVGAIHANRDDPQTRETVGFFSETLAVPCALVRENESLSELLQRCHDQLTQTFAHLVPFGDVVARVAESGGHRAPLLRNALAVRETPHRVREEVGAGGERWWVDVQTPDAAPERGSPFEVFLALNLNGDVIDGMVRAKGSSSDVACLADRFRRVLVAMAAEPKRSVEDLLSEWAPPEHRPTVDRHALHGATDGAPGVKLLTDHPRRPALSRETAVIDRALSAEQEASLRRVAADNDLSVGALALSAFEAMLSVYAGSRRFALTVEVADRGLQRRTQVRADLGDQEVQLLDVARRAMAELRGKMTPERGHAAPPDPSLAAVVLRAPFELLSRGASSEASAVEQRWALAEGVELCLELRPVEGGFTCRYHYDTSLFDRGTVQDMVACCSWVLDQLGSQPELRLRELTWVSPVQREQLVAQSRGGGLTPNETPKFGHLANGVRAAARRHPERIALVAPEGTWTYAALDEQAARLASTLRARGVRRGDLVGLCASPGAKLVTALLAIHRCGGAYVPLDPANPTSRLRAIMADCDPALVVVDDVGASLVPDVVRRLHLEEDEWMTSPPLAEDEESYSASDIAYVTYTSGSTGAPKGVAVTHGNVTRLFAATHRHVSVTEKDVLLSSHSFAFDVSVWETWGALLHGASLVLPPPAWSPQDRLELIRRHGVTVMCQTPSAFSALVDADAVAPGRYPSLRHVLLAGEAVNLDAVGRFLERHEASGVAVANVHGITEATVYDTYAALTRDDVLRDHVSPIGRPLADVDVYLLDPEGRLVPPGAPGEMCIAGPGVAVGYHRRPELNAERFVEHALCAGRLYRSGDRARWHAGGLDFLGRGDSQVKVRGFRVELGEVETALHGHASVLRAAVLLNQQRLVAYLELDDDNELSRVKTHLTRTLPGYMVPSVWIPVDELPLTTSGKIDRTRLSNLEHGGEPSASAHGAVEQRVAALWRKVLNVEAVDRDASFFSLGGTSLDAARLVGQLEVHFGVRVPLKTFFTEARSVALLAAELERRGASSTCQGAIAIQHQRAAIPPLTGIDAAALATLTPTMAEHLGISRNELRDGLMGGEPAGVVSITTPWGTIGCYLLPLFEAELYLRTREVESLVRVAAQQANRAGAEIVALTGLIPSALPDYGDGLSWPGLSCELTTGHNLTCAAVALNARAAVEGAGRDWRDERVGVLGLGSIGRGALEILLSDGHPREVLLCDVEEARLHELDEALTSRGIRTRVVPSYGMAPASLYEATTIIGATNVPDVLDVSRLAPGTIVVDDSAPHCFDVSSAIARMRDHGDVMLIEAGRVSVPGTVDRRSHLPAALSSRLPEETWEAFLGRDANLMACLLSGLLGQAYRSHFPPQLGTSSVSACRDAAHGFEALGVQPAVPHLGDGPIPRQLARRPRPARSMAGRSSMRSPT